MDIYTARIAGQVIESLSLQGAVKAACRALGASESDAYTVQNFPGCWLLVTDRRDVYASTLIRVSS